MISYSGMHILYLQSAEEKCIHPTDQSTRMIIKKINSSFSTSILINYIKIITYFRAVCCVYLSIGDIFLSFL